jgi:hypothetical protein
MNDALDRNSGGFTAADAERGDTALQTLCFEGVQQGHDEARACGPMGWPSAQAPPLMLSFSRGMARSRAAAIGTTAKASLISNRSTSPTLQPTLSSSLRIVGIGAVVNHCGSWLWVACPLISAKIGRPSRSASERRASTSAAAPSALAEDAAGVMVPLGRNAGFNPGIFAGSTLSGISSLPMLREPASSVTVSGAISALNAPLSTALRARSASPSRKHPGPCG